MTNSERISEALRRRAMYHGELMQRLEIKNNTLSIMLWKMTKRGQVTHDNRLPRKWRLVGGAAGC